MTPPLSANMAHGIGERETLLALAERCEAAAGPDRQLDVSILTTALGFRDIMGDQSLFDRGNDGYWSLEGDEKNRPLPSPTGSIDAALTLVPEGFDWIIGRTNGGLTIHAEVGDREQYFGNTPALALCCAALRARALPAA